MRIISGAFKGRQIHTLSGTRTRPTTGKVREAVFSSLQAHTASSVWLDLYAGSGGIGIEALSRGADFCWFVENNPQACQVIRMNLSSLNISEDKAVLLCKDAETACRLISKDIGRAVNIVYLDPPYAESDQYLKAIACVEMVLAPGGLIVIEHHKQDLPSVSYADLVKTKYYGLSAVSFYQKGDY